MLTASQILRQSTHAGHVALERTPLASDLMCPELTTRRYVEILAIWAAAWTALENCIWASPAMHEIEALLPRQSADLAQDDLRYWSEQGYGVPELHHASQRWHALRPNHVPELLGVCYVARGASLGSKVIAAQLQKTLRLSEGRGTSFFSTNGPNNVSTLSWPKWTARLDAQLLSPETRAMAVVWANATFAALHDSFLNLGQAQPQPQSVA